jgi:hypothetical protein
MAYQVFQDGKPCSSYKINGWNIDTFETQKEAEEFAVFWAYPISRNLIQSFYRPMKLNVPIDMSMGETPVMMEIRKLS